MHTIHIGGVLVLFLLGGNRGKNWGVCGGGNCNCIRGGRRQRSGGGWGRQQQRQWQQRQVDDWDSKAILMTKAVTAVDGEGTGYGCSNVAAVLISPSRIEPGRPQYLIWVLVTTDRLALPKRQCNVAKEYSCYFYGRSTSTIYMVGVIVL